MLRLAQEYFSGKREKQEQEGGFRGVEEVLKGLAADIKRTRRTNALVSDSLQVEGFSTSTCLPFCSAATALS